MKEHIKTLKEMLSWPKPIRAGEAIEAAIAALKFQDSCVDRDEASEAEYCQMLAWPLANVSPDSPRIIANALIRERAKVRGEMARRETFDPARVRKLIEVCDGYSWHADEPLMRAAKAVAESERRVVAEPGEG